jgi:DNA-binding CsgD family transcriptional regulator
MAATTDVGPWVPVPDDTIAAVAAEHAVSESALAEALARIHADLVDGADAIHQYYESADGGPSLDAADGLATVLFVPEQQWRRLPTDLTDEMRAAAKAAHAEFARDCGASEETLTSSEALVMPSATVGELARAGLSPRQADVHVLREAGLTQAEIGDRLGMATNTVKVHCHRVDTKVENAARLLGLVGT